jgi:nucleoside-triphosphatase
MIYILTGAIRTGKTSALLDWADTRTDVDGLLCPDDDFGKRYFLKVASKEEFPLEVNNGNLDDLIEIGPFQFLKSAFTKANNFLFSFASEMERQYLIIDELGKLELKNQGLHSAAETLIPEFIQNRTQHLILVVRDYLLDEIVEYYDISEYQLLKKEDLTSLSFRT